MAAKPLGVLILGAGWVSTQHIAAFKNNPHTRIAGICDRTVRGAEKRAAEFDLDVPCYEDYRKALLNPAVDLVVVCTPQHLHCEHAIEAARAGKHILIEKPAGLSMAQLRRMQRAVKRAQVQSLVSFVLRWNPLFQTIKRMGADVAFGKVYAVEADYLSHNGYWWTGWKDTCTRKNGVSAMLVAGCHAIDALRWFAAPGEFEAATPVEVFALAGGYRKNRKADYDPISNSWVRDTPPMEYDGLEVALVRFENGAIGKVSVNFDCIMPYRFPLRIFGDRGTVMDNRVWSHKFPGQKNWVELPAIQPDSSDVTHHPFQAEVDHFVACIERGVESHCNLADAIKTHEVVFAALECYRTKRPVAIRRS